MLWDFFKTKEIKDYGHYIFKSDKNWNTLIWVASNFWNEFLSSIPDIKTNKLKLILPKQNKMVPTVPLPKNV